MWVFPVLLCCICGKSIAFVALLFVWSGGYIFWGIDDFKKLMKHMIRNLMMLSMCPCSNLSSWIMVEVMIFLWIKTEGKGFNVMMPTMWPGLLKGQCYNKARASIRPGLPWPQLTNHRCGFSQFCYTCGKFKNIVAKLLLEWPPLKVLA